MTNKLLEIVNATEHEHEEILKAIPKMSGEEAAVLLADIIKGLNQATKQVEKNK